MNETYTNPDIQHFVIKAESSTRGKAWVKKGQALNLLLDTHVALWAITDSSKLTFQARDLITSPK